MTRENYLFIHSFIPSFICKGDQFCIQPHIRARPRATKHNRAKCRRQHHSSIRPTTEKNSGGRQKKPLVEILKFSKKSKK